MKWLRYELKTFCREKRNAIVWLCAAGGQTDHLSNK